MFLEYLKDIKEIQKIFQLKFPELSNKFKFSVKAMDLRSVGNWISMPTKHESRNWNGELKHWVRFPTVQLKSVPH